MVATRRLEPDRSSRRSTSRRACPPARLGHSRWLARPGRKAASWLPTDSPMVQHRAVAAAAVKVCHAGECPMVCGSRAPRGVGVQGVRWLGAVRCGCPPAVSGRGAAPQPAMPRSLKQCPALPWGLRRTRRRPCDCPLPLVKTRPSRRLRGWRPRAGVRPSGPGVRLPVRVSGVRGGCAPTRRGRPCSCRRSRASGRHSIAGLSQGCRSPGGYRKRSPGRRPLVGCSQRRRARTTRGARRARSSARARVIAGRTRARGSSPGSRASVGHGSRRAASSPPPHRRPAADQLTLPPEAGPPNQPPTEVRPGEAVWLYESLQVDGQTRAGHERPKRALN